MRDRLRKRAELIPLGFNWAFVVTVDATLLLVVAVMIVQRPLSDLPVALPAGALALSPLAAFFVSGVKFKSLVLWATSTAAAALFLFATSAPVGVDYTPFLLVLMVSVVSSLSGHLGGSLAAASAAALLVAASLTHRLDDLFLYLPVLAMGWLVGFLMRIQQQLILKQQEAQEALAQHAVADERRRIAREIHDVIAHSLSVTLLHVTGARRALEQDRDVEDAVEALGDAERLGRQAMGDIRRTVGLLDSGPLGLPPEPGVDDIPRLVDDFVTAGLPVTLCSDGRTDRVSGAVGLALYRIAQESLANIAKHAPESESALRLHVSKSTATMSVANTVPAAHRRFGAVSDGRGLRGMRQRVELLGGAIDAGPDDDGWVVRAAIPLESRPGWRPPWCGG